MAMVHPWNQERYLRHLQLVIHSPGFMGPKRFLGAETIRAYIITALSFSVDADVAARLASSLPACTLDIRVSTAVLGITDGGAATQLLITGSDHEAEGESSSSSGVESSSDDNDTPDSPSRQPTATSSQSSAPTDNADVKSTDDDAQSCAEPPRPRRLLPCHFAVERHLGSGGFGNVYRARHVYTGRLVALKVFDKRKVDERLVFNEASILRSVATDNHVNVMQVMGYCHDEKQWAIAMVRPLSFGVMCLGLTTCMWRRSTVIAVICILASRNSAQSRTSSCASMPPRS